MAGSKFGTLVSKIRAAPSDAPDGLTNDEAAAPTVDTQRTGFLTDLLNQAEKGRLFADGRAVAQGITTMASGKPLDDRKLLLEHGVALLQTLPEHSASSQELSDKFIGVLWNDLPHPPITRLGPEGRYHSADGSGNNPYLPDLGKAGSSYSRSVTPRTPKPANLPDPGVIFDALLKRDKFVPHPSGLSSFFFAFATLVIHECFQTNREKFWINDTSSYVDLSTLYGNNQEEQNKVRSFENGLLWPDVISSSRIMMMPPAVTAVLIMFSRNHNYIAHKLLQINESGRYNSDLSKLTDEQKKWQDEDIFQLSRNINVAFFASVVLRDYVSAILNTVRADSSWNLQLGAEIMTGVGQRLPRGTGNVVSCEFNVLYRWHAALSVADEKWTEALFSKTFPDRDLSTLTPREFFTVAAKAEAELEKKEPKEWEIHGLQRGPDGRYDDDALAEILKNATDEPAGAFKARGSPGVFKIVDIMGMMQAREAFNVCTMNEMRKYLNLKPFSTFLEWNSDPEIAAVAEKLYGHPDNLELYPGLLAEEAKPAMPGSGVCPGHTIGRAILDDAVSLVRGDRFLSTDFGVGTLTSWGFEQMTPYPGSYGGMLTKIMMNVLPQAYPYNSTYATFPFYTPQAIQDALTKNKKIQLYDTVRPVSARPMVGINTFAGCKKVFEDRETFGVQYQGNIKKVTNGHGFLIGYDDEPRHDPPKAVLENGLFPPGFEGPLNDFYAKKSATLIKQKSFNFSGTNARYLDVVRDVCNVVPIMYIADVYGIPLKTAETPHGLLSPPELHLMLVALFVYTSFDQVPKASWALRDGAMKSSEVLRGVVEARLKSNGGIMNRLSGVFGSKMGLQGSSKSHAFYRTLLASGRSVGDLVGDCIGSMIPIAGNITQQSALLVDLYLSPQYEAEKNRIIELAHQDTKEADDELLGYIWEGDPVVLGLPRVLNKDAEFRDGDRTLSLKKGDKILISTSNAHMDPTVFPNPEKIDPKRPKNSYMLLGHGLHYCLGARLVGTSIRAVLKEVFKLKNLRRAPGAAGHFTRITEELAGSKAHIYLSATSQESPFPASLAVMYDVE